ncbi:MAG TPA: twin-arginine translocation signal domain-containing protein [Mycobacteriales bacterium]|nr:twin-arginine translocation signal domain-containing protein [Mycobacteriales bacterium]
MTLETTALTPTGESASGAARPRLLALVDRIAGVLDDRSSRRGFLARVAVVGSAVAVAPVQYALRPGTAYANVCGTQSTCSSGYTVFCATINNGVNRCPPNSLVGGWWKTDGSGFCCGSTRYYIDCHSYCSCGCGGGSRFCGEGCRSCSCGCGPSGQCDQRRVCCNNFRYGQCMQHVSCTGPVWCRVVTCTPPWRIPQWRCTTTSATDSNTASHSAPLVPGCTPVVRKHTALGGPGGKLGEPTTGELTTRDGRGRFTNYDGGGILSHPELGAFAFFGSIRDKYYALQGERGKLGYPRSDENPAADGQGYWNHFQGGDIWWHPRYGTRVMYGSIRDKFYAYGWERGKLGYPTSDEIRSPDGQGYFNTFVGGDVYWHPRHGTSALFYAIRDKYVALGRERGKLGYPTSDETRSTDGVGYFNRFVGGDVYWHPQHGTRVLYYAIRDTFTQWGRERGKLGYPTSDETRSTDGVGYFNRFVGGDVYWHPQHGTAAMFYAIRDTFTALGRETGVLGYPTTDERSTVRGGTYNDFSGSNGQAASIYWSPATGTFSVRGVIRTEWLRLGGAGGELGFPTSEPYGVSGGRTRSDFENGSLTHDPATGRVTRS